VVDPRTGDVIKQVASADEADVDAAIKAARNAFDEGPWPKLGGKVSCGVDCSKRTDYCSWCHWWPADSASDSRYCLNLFSNACLKECELHIAVLLKPIGSVLVALPVLAHHPAKVEGDKVE
jgi:hypothetical protein